MMRWLAFALLIGCKSDPSTDAPKVAVTVVPKADAAAPQEPADASDADVADTPAGPLKKRDFASVMSLRNVGMRKQCFEPYEDKGPACVVLEVTVSADGKVASVTITSSTSTLVGPCLMKLVKTFRFPPSETGGTFPFSMCRP